MINHLIQRWVLSGGIRSSAIRLGLNGTSLLLPLVLWLVVSHAQVVDSAFLPSPAQVINSLWFMAHSGILMADASASIYRVMLGFLLAAVVGVPLGITLHARCSIHTSTDYLSGH